MTETLSVVQLLSGMETAVIAAFPGPIWVRGEISGFKRTNRGAGFFKLVDPDQPENSVEVAARGRVMADIDRDLDTVGVGSLRAGIEVRLEATVALRRGSSLVQLSLLRVDPEFIAGRLAVDRAEVLRRLKTDGLLDLNAQLPLPLVPLKVGLVTSRGSAAHADFLNHLKSPGYRFRVSTVEAAMQGETSAEQVVRGLDRLSREPVDVVTIVRGGGSKLDLAAFDSEELGRRIAGMPVPVVTGIGHETDRSIADEVAAVAEKTPTAAAGWLVARVAEYARRIDTARDAIRDESLNSVARTAANLNHLAAQLSGSREVLKRQQDQLTHLAVGVAERAREGLRQQSALVESYGSLIATMGLEPTLRRGFAVVTRPDGSAVREAGSLSAGERVRVQMFDGKVWMTVEGRDE
ncbi:MAG: exodeoxyribonuclease VII large subunit [Acidimicrobiia bacterium]